MLTYIKISYRYIAIAALLLNTAGVAQAGGKNTELQKENINPQARKSLHEESLSIPDWNDYLFSPPFTLPQPLDIDNIIQHSTKKRKITSTKHKTIQNIDYSSNNTLSDFKELSDYLSTFEKSSKNILFAVDFDNTLAQRVLTVSGKEYTLAATSSWKHGKCAQIFGRILENAESLNQVHKTFKDNVSYTLLDPTLHTLLDTHWFNKKIVLSGKKDDKQLMRSGFSGSLGFEYIYAGNKAKKLQSLLKQDAYKHIDTVIFIDDNREDVEKIQHIKTSHEIIALTFTYFENLVEQNQNQLKQEIDELIVCEKLLHTDALHPQKRSSSLVEIGDPLVTFPHMTRHIKSENGSFDLDTFDFV